MKDRKTVVIAMRIEVGLKKEIEKVANEELRTFANQCEIFLRMGKLEFQRRIEGGGKK